MVRVQAAVRSARRGHAGPRPGVDAVAGLARARRRTGRGAGDRDRRPERRRRRARATRPAGFRRYDWVVVTSANGARRLLDAVARRARPFGAARRRGDRTGHRRRARRAAASSPTSCPTASSPRRSSRRSRRPPRRRPGAPGAGGGRARRAARRAPGEGWDGRCRRGVPDHGPSPIDDAARRGRQRRRS